MTALSVDALSSSKRKMFIKRRQGLLIACVRAAVHVHNSVHSTLHSVCFLPADNKQPHFLPASNEPCFHFCLCVHLIEGVCVWIIFP